MLKWLSNCIVAFLLALSLSFAPAMAEDSGKLSKQELDQLLAPIALYPDDLLTNVLMASTYPLDVVEAARWKKEATNAKLKGDALTEALAAKVWDPSVKALVQFPSVLETMSDKLDWTRKLGDAFLAQQGEVLDEIQFLRGKADDAGNLKSNKQQKVVKESGTDAKPIYIIEPATPETVYVPVYQPSVVYGSWWYPDYPPYYWSYPDASFVNGYFWGAGVAIATGIWGWNRFDWHDHEIDIDVDRWNKINVDRSRITSKKWEHRPERRGQVPYKGKEVRDKFKQTDRRPGNKDFRGFDKGDIDRSKIEAKLKDVERGAIKDKVGDRAGPKINRDVATTRDRPKVNRDIDRPTANARRSSPGAFDVKRGSDVRRAANRGHASRVAMKGRGGGAQFRGGGRRGGGARGGGRGGGRRSDVRVKHDIVLLGRFANGMGFYRFAYNDSQKLYVGVIAQEAVKVMPQAVTRDGEGYLRVDYDKLGLPFQSYDRWLDSGARLPKLSPH